MQFIHLILLVVFLYGNPQTVLPVFHCWAIIAGKWSRWLETATIIGCLLQEEVSGTSTDNTVYFLTVHLLG